MPQPHFEVASGAINGANRVFTVSKPYQAGTTAVFLNGQLKRMDYDDGWAETNPAQGIVTLDVAPIGPEAFYPGGDVVQIFYIDTSPVQPGVEVSPLIGTLVEANAIQGVVIDPYIFHGVLD